MSGDPDLIWNRAALEKGGSSAREGDRALAALLEAHGLIANGGVLHCADVLDADEIATAIDGYRPFGLTPAADVLDEVQASPFGELTEQSVNLDERYWSFITDDSVLESAFQRRLSAWPDEFAPA